VLELTSERLRLVALDEHNLRLSVEDPGQMMANLGLHSLAVEPEREVREAQQQMLAELQGDRHNQLWYTSWQIVQRHEQHIIGGLCFKGPPDKRGVVELGYGLSPEHQGRGYMTEALRTVIEWAFQQPAVQAIAAETDRKNLASHRLLRRLAFTVHHEAGQMLWWRLDRPRAFQAERS
jgi:RimJ/RimL family protein N-acetyltransferase